MVYGRPCQTQPLADASLQHAGTSTTQHLGWLLPSVSCSVCGEGGDGRDAVGRHLLSLVMAADIPVETAAG
jgi:hypothetical protein